MSEIVHFRCPHCQAKFRVTAQHAGRSFDCPKCQQHISVPGTAPAAAPGPADWDELVAYLRSGKPADITKVTDVAVTANVTRYYETKAADPDCPKLTYYLLTAKDPGATPFLVVTAGTREEMERAWNFDYKPQLQKALPGMTWTDLYRNSASDVSNHSKPGCHLASTDPFDRLAAAIADRKYQLRRVLRPTGAAPTKPKGPRWDVQVFGDEVVRPDLACQLCGENRVAFGFYGTHLKCHSCGTIYCRRNCAASIHGQCPRCGECDRIDGLKEPPAAPAKPAKPARARSDDELTGELVRLVGGDAGFGNKDAIRAIGEELNDAGGMDRMQKVYYLVRKQVYFSQDIWDGIGSWRS